MMAAPPAHRASHPSLPAEAGGRGNIHKGAAPIEFHQLRAGVGDQVLQAEAEALGSSVATARAAWIIMPLPTII